MVGPDGVGKTTVARALIRQYHGPTRYFHFVPPLFRPLQTSPPDGDMPAPDKGGPHGWPPLGWIRLARTVVRAWLVYAARIRPSVRRGSLVVGDRWLYGYVVQPLALRYYGPPRLARLALRASPRVDLVVNLAAPPDVIHARKQELSIPQIEAELARWSALPAAAMRPVDACQPPDEIARQILEAL